MTLIFLKKLHSVNKRALIKNNGFTFIELLVTVSIMLIITGGGIAAFVRFNDKQSVQVAVKDLQTMLRAAQIKAKSGEGANGCAGDEKLRGYRVHIANGSNQATLYRVCAISKFSAPGDRSYLPRSTIEFDSNVTASGEVDVEFLALLGGVDGAGTITITGLDNYTYSFVVTEGGEIREGSFQ